MRMSGIRLARSASAALVAAAILVVFAGSANAQTAPNASATPAATASTLSTPVPVGPMPIYTPVPIPPHPDVNGHIACPQSVVCLTYDAGRPAQVGCAFQTVCTILLPGESILSGGIAGVQGAGGGDSSQPQGLWSVLPFTQNGDSMLTISPYANSPFTNITVKTDQHFYVIALRPDYAARGTVYEYLYPDQHNNIVVPQEARRAYATPTPEPPGEELAPAPCPASYSVKPQNSPSFWPHSVWIHDDSVTVSFDASTTLPTVGLPMQGNDFPVDLNHLGLAPVDYDAQGRTRSITVLACYASIVFYTTDGRGRHAVVLEATP